MTAKITVRIEGVRRLLNSLEPDSLYAAQWRKALDQAVRIAETSLKKRAPGRLGKLVKMKIQTRPVPLWGRARMPNKSRKGFRYPGALHGGGGRKRRAFHYRSGPFRGQVTKGWFTKARAAVEEQIWRLLDKAEQEIEAKWGRR